MEVLKESLFSSDFQLDVSSLLFTYRQDLDSIIDSSFSLETNNISNLDTLKVKILFSNIELDNPDFSEAEEYTLTNFIQENRLNLSTENSLFVENLFVYLYFYNLTGSVFTTYEKIFFEELIRNGQVVSGNFVDLRLKNVNSVVQENVNQKEYLLSAFQETKQDLFKQDFISNLFYNSKQNNQVGLFFGIDQEGYFKKNNFIKFLDHDEDFGFYLSNNNFITSIEGYVYNDKDFAKNDPIPSSVNLKYLFGDLYETSFAVAGDLHRTENYGYQINCYLRNAIVDYALNYLLPELKTEADLLSSLKLGVGEFEYLPRLQVGKTLDSLKGLTLETTQDLKDTFTIFDSSDKILLNNDLVDFLLLANKNASEVLTKSTEIKRLSDSNSVHLSKDFGKIIDLKDIRNSTEVHGFGIDNTGLATVNISDYTNRASQELQKYFSTTSTTLTLKGSEQIVDLESLSYGYLTGLGNVVGNKTALENNKSVNYKFSYDDYLMYVSAIDKIVSEKINYRLKTSQTLDVERVTFEELIVEQQSEQISSFLNSLTAVVVPKISDDGQRAEFLSNKQNIIKTFELPSTLRTDLCTDNVTQSDPNNEKISQRKANPDSFIGNNILAFSVITNLQKFTDKNFYEFYRYLEKNDLDVQNTPLQTIFLKKYYQGELESEYEFLNKNDLYKNFVVYGLIYFMFKNIFKVMIYLPSLNDYTVINREVLEQLESGQNYLCFVDYYTDEKTGVKTPEKLQTSIYNRYFVIEA